MLVILFNVKTVDIKRINDALYNISTLFTSSNLAKIDIIRLPKEIYSTATNSTAIIAKLKVDLEDSGWKEACSKKLQDIIHSCVDEVQDIFSLDVHPCLEECDFNKNPNCSECFCPHCGIHKALREQKVILG